MHYGTIKKLDTANGPGLRISLFVSGCPHGCVGCFNAVAWDFTYGSLFTQEVIDQILKELKNPFIAGITLLGGEPLAPENQEEVWNLLRQIKEKLPNKSIRCFSGYTYEFITTYMFPNLPYTYKIFTALDVLVDGRFEQDLLDLKLKFRGSKNQRVIDVPLSLQRGGVIRSEEIDDKNAYVYRDSGEIERFSNLFKK